MSRRTGALLIAALALSVAVLGLFLCTRCERARDDLVTPIPSGTLTIRDGVE